MATAGFPSVKEEFFEFFRQMALLPPVEPSNVVILGGRWAERTSKFPAPAATPVREVSEDVSFAEPAFSKPTTTHVP